MKYVLALIIGLNAFIGHSQNCGSVVIPMDDSIVDISSGTQLQLNSVPMTLSATGIPNHAVKFNGTSSYIELNGGGPIITGDFFSISITAKIDGSGGGTHGTNILFSQRANSINPGGAIINLYAENMQGQVKLNVRKSGASSGLSLTYPTPLDNQFHCYTATYGEDDTLRLFIDNIQVSSGKLNQSGDFTSNVVYCQIGRHSYSSIANQGLFNGVISNFEAYNCFKTIDEFCAPENTSCLTLDVDNVGDDIVDGSTFNRPLAITSSGLLSGSLYFDGIDDFVTVNNNIPIIYKDEFTIVAYAKIFGNGGGQNGTNILFSQRDDDLFNGGAIINFYAENMTGNVRLNVRKSGNTNGIDVQYPTPTDGALHCYVAKLGSDDTLRLFIDGIEVDKTAFSQSGNFYSQVDWVQIGRHSYGGVVNQGTFNGQIVDLRIYNCDASEALYCPEKTNECLKLDLPIQDSVWDFSTYHHLVDFESVGFNFNQLSTAGSAIEFTHDTQVVEVNDGVPIIGASSFTLALDALSYGYGGGTNGQSILFSQKGDGLGANESHIKLYADKGGYITAEVKKSTSSNVSVVTYPSPRDEQWHCYALQYFDNDSMVLFFDGTHVADTVNVQTGNFTNQIQYVEIGREQEQGVTLASFRGRIDQLQVFDCIISVEELCSGIASGLNNPVFESKQFNLPGLISASGNGAPRQLSISNKEELYDARMTIYDIHGRIVFEGDTWNGRVNGQVASGTYIYRVIGSKAQFAGKVVVMP